MARPWRRVLINLSIRLGISIRELEQIDVATIRQYLAMLADSNKPAQPEGTPAIPRPQSSDEIVTTFNTILGKKPKG